MTALPSPASVLPAGWVEASYRQPSEAESQGNILIEALPPQPTRAGWGNALRQTPRFDPSEVSLSKGERASLVRMRLSELFVPLPRHLGLAEDLFSLIRHGYRGRNPLTPDFTRELQLAYDAIQAGAGGKLPVRPTRPMLGMTILGPSGSGKTTLIELVLAQMVQKIWHRRHGVFQLSYLKTDFPSAISGNQLARKLYGSLRDLAPEGSVPPLPSRSQDADVVIPKFALYANQLNLGLIVLDELQNVCIGRAGGQTEILNTLQLLANCTRIPIVMTGTLRALPMLFSEIRTARRASSAGDYLWDRLSRAPRGGELRLLLEALFKYQWLKNPVELTDALEQAFFESTAGIPALVVTLYILAHLEALVGSEERLTEKIVSATARKRLRIFQALVEQYRRGENTVAAELELRISNSKFVALQHQRIAEGVDRVISSEGVSKQARHDAVSFEHTRAIEALMSLDYSRLAATEALTSLGPEHRDLKAGDLVQAVLGLKKAG